MNKQVCYIAALLFCCPLLGTRTQAQDAAALEEQYKTCAKHYIPADKCTPEIYKQLKTKDEAPPDTKTGAALSALKEYRGKLRNPESMQVHMAYVTDEGAVCLEVAGQNGAGGMSVSRVVYFTPDWAGAKRLKGHWLDEGGFGGAAARDIGGGYEVNRWQGPCTKGTFHPKLVPGMDVTDKVNQVLKAEK